MKKFSLVAVGVCAITMSHGVFANQLDYCDGFEEGFQRIAGIYTSMPICPEAPKTPAGSTDFQEGMTEGMAAADGSTLLKY